MVKCVVRRGSRARACIVAWHGVEVWWWGGEAGVAQCWWHARTWGCASVVGWGMWWYRGTHGRAARRSTALKVVYGCRWRGAGAREAV
jgi:hypothetical protein